MYSSVPTIWPCSVRVVPGAWRSSSARATPKSMIFGCGSPWLSATRMFDGLRSRWTEALVVRVLHAVADLQEEAQPGGERQVAIAAVLAEVHAAHQLHHEVGPARGRRAAAEDLRDVRVVHEGERLPLGVEARGHPLRVHPGLHDLERDAAAHRPRLLRLPDLAHPAFAQQPDQLVVAEPPAALGPARDRLPAVQLDEQRLRQRAAQPVAGRQAVRPGRAAQQPVDRPRAARAGSGRRGNGPRAAGSRSSASSNRRSISCQRSGRIMAVPQSPDGGLTGENAVRRRSRQGPGDFRPRRPRLLPRRVARMLSIIAFLR
jgi:hypothetical protein